VGRRVIGAQRALEMAEKALAVDGADEVEVTLYAECGGLTRFADSIIHQHTERSDAQIRVRVVTGKRSASASTNRLDDDAIARTGRRALEMARLSPPDDLFPGLPGDFGASRLSPAQEAERFDGATAAATPGWRADRVAEAVKAAGDRPVAGFFSTSADEVALANTNSVEYSLLLRDMDAIAAQLKKVASNNIPVLWRPLHEASGGWFWWGAKGATPFKALWRLLYNRLTTYHNLHNLIWAISNEDPNWYPGNDVVDIVGVDAYPSDIGDALSPNWMALRAQFNGVKLLALTEFGGVPDIERMQVFGVYWAYFACWEGSFLESMPAATLCTKTWLQSTCCVSALVNSSGIASNTGPAGGPPVLFRRMWIGPCCRACSCAFSCSPWGSVKSATRIRCVWPRSAGSSR